MIMVSFRRHQEYRSRRNSCIIGYRTCAETRDRFAQYKATLETCSSMPDMLGGTKLTGCLRWKGYTNKTEGQPIMPYGVSQSS